MNENHCWYNLNVDVSDAVRNSWLWQSTDHNNNMRKYANDEIFNNSWLDRMSAINMPITGSLVHHKPKFFSSSEAHVDTYKGIGGACFGINWVIGGQDGEMVWYELPDEVHRGVKRININLETFIIKSIRK
jgi:predicted small secreted protein